jgi:hypothetical protein
MLPTIRSNDPRSADQLDAPGKMGASKTEQGIPMKSIRTGLFGLTLSAAAAVVVFGTIPAHAQNPKACVAAVAKASQASGLPKEYVTPQNVATACKAAKLRPALATRNFTHRFVVKAKVEEMKPAADSLAKQCPGRLNAVSKALRLP